MTPALLLIPAAVAAWLLTKKKRPTSMSDVELYEAGMRVVTGPCDGSQRAQWIAMELGRRAHRSPSLAQLQQQMSAWGYACKLAEKDALS